MDIHGQVTDRSRTIWYHYQGGPYIDLGFLGPSPNNVQEVINVWDYEISGPGGLIGTAIEAAKGKKGPEARAIIRRAVRRTVEDWIVDWDLEGDPDWYMDYIRNARY